MRRELLRIQNGFKADHHAVRLKDIQIELCYGEIQGVFFENRSEEESLLAVLSGAAELDGGRVYYRNNRCDLKAARKLFRERLFLPMLRSRWAEELTVTDFFSLHKNSFYISRKVSARKIRTLGQVFGLLLDPEQPVAQLTDMQKIQLELIRAYERGYEAVILRGLSALPGADVWNGVMALLNELRSRGMAFLVFDHAEIPARICTAEIYEVSRGRTVFVYRREELAAHLLARAQMKRREQQAVLQGSEILKLQDVTLTHDQKEPLNLTVRTGELVTVLDSAGAYVDCLAAVLRGERTAEAGGIWYRNTSLTGIQLPEIIRRGIGFIEEREGEYSQELFYDLSALENIGLLMAVKESGRLVRKNRQQSLIAESSRFFTAGQMLQPVAELEPWQRQRLMYYRWYLFYPQLLVCIRPLTSLDRQMRRESERMIREFQARGMAVLILTTNAMAAESIGGRLVVL